MYMYIYLRTIWLRLQCVLYCIYTCMCVCCNNSVRCLLFSLSLLLPSPLHPSLFHRSTDQLMLTKVFTTHPRNAMPQCCLTVDCNSDSCPLNEPSGSSAGSFASSAEKSSSVRTGPSPSTKSLQQVRSISPGGLATCIHTLHMYCAYGGTSLVCTVVCGIIIIIIYIPCTYVSIMLEEVIMHNKVICVC